MVIIVTTQHTTIGVVILILLSLVSMIYLLCILIWADPYEGWAANLQRISFEICIFCFFASVGAKLLNLQHIYIDYAVIGLTVICVLAQVFYTIYYTINICKAFCRRSRARHSSVLSSVGSVQRSKYRLAAKPSRVVEDSLTKLGLRRPPKMSLISDKNIEVGENAILSNESLPKWHPVNKVFFQSISCNNIPVGQKTVSPAVIRNYSRNDLTMNATSSQRSIAVRLPSLAQPSSKVKLVLPGAYRRRRLSTLLERNPHI